METREIRRTNLKKLMDHLFGSERGAQTRLADALGRSQNYISRCLADPSKKGAKAIGEDLAREIEDAFSLERYALDSTSFSADRTKALTTWSIEAKKDSNVIAADFQKGRLKDGEIAIPQFDVRAAMGAGQVAPDYVETIRHLTLHQGYLSTLGVRYTQPGNLAIVTGHGQSMEGTINDGDPVIIDRGVQSFIGDGIYLLTWNDLLFIKRLQMVSATEVEMISDNPKHKDRVVKLDELTIHAKVLLAWNARKL
ncbi:S24 family peptidase [Marinobacterium sp. AK62]|uniref:S24 family peptidase n=1 Tax=Marinobacterium alkalitolerans TaxID=1542925 RepID=A0ABS3Z7J6_9GAMM|nr:S24 family peptidase [Marinobacterium alkalitolerans]MBP0047675.1 S24 family peptidase [Marinobacterium alkalitolerans]